MAYSYKRKISIDESKCGTADSTDFPFCFAGTYDWLATTANGGNVENANGYDVAFFSDEALTTQLKHEVEKWTAATGAVVYWVKVPTLSASANTEIWIAYGDSGISTTQADAANTWPSHFHAVYHLAEARSTSAGAYKDSTSNANHGTLTDADSDTASTTAKIGAGVDFNGDADSIAVADSTSLRRAGTFSLSCWFKADTLPGAGAIIGIIGKGKSGDASGDNHNYWLWLDNGVLASGNGLVGGFEATNGTNYQVKDTTTQTGVWYHAVLVHDAAADTVKLYANNSLIGTTTGVTATPEVSNASFVIGRGRDAADWYFDGIVDEVRLSESALSASWVAAEYNNQNSPSTFYSVGEVPVTGSASVTLGAVVCTATGALTSIGTSAGTVGAVVPTAVGVLEFTGSAAITTGQVVASAGGNLAFTGSVAAMVDPIGASASGSHVFVGAANATLGVMIASGAGSLSSVGTINATLGAVICTASGTVESAAYIGMCSATAGTVTCSASGLLAFVGICAAATGAAVCAASGTHDSSFSYVGTVNVLVRAPIATAVGMFWERVIPLPEMRPMGWPQFNPKTRNVYRRTMGGGK